MNDAQQLREAQHQKICSQQTSLQRLASINVGVDNEINQKKQNFTHQSQTLSRFEQILREKSELFVMTCQNFDQARGEQQKLSIECQHLQKDIETAKQKNNFIIESQKQLLKHQDMETQKNQDLEHRLTSLDSKLSQLD